MRVIEYNPHNEHFITKRILFNKEDNNKELERIIYYDDTQRNDHAIKKYTYNMEHKYWKNIDYNYKLRNDKTKKLIIYNEKSKINYIKYFHNIQRKDKLYSITKYKDSEEFYDNISIYKNSSDGVIKKITFKENNSKYIKCIYYYDYTKRINKSNKCIIFNKYHPNMKLLIEYEYTERNDKALLHIVYKNGNTKRIYDNNKKNNYKSISKFINI